MAENFTKMFSQSIGVKEPWYIDRAGFDERKQEVHVYVRARERAQYPCPECGATSPRYDNEDEERTWRHGDVVFYPCYVHCRRPRVKCEEHGIHVVSAPWARPNSRYTMLFEAYAMLLATDMPVLKTSKALRCSHEAVTGIVQHWVNKAVEEDDLSTVTRMNLDETPFKRGQSYVTVVIDGKARRVIGVERGRGKEAVEAFCYQMEAKGGDCNKIESVASDMSGAYLSAVQECFPEAKSVIDKFHVKKLLLDAMEQVRKAEQGLRSRARGTGKKLLMIPQAKANEEQRAAVESLSKTYPKTGRAYRIVQALDMVYDSADPQTAEERLASLIQWMRRSRLEPMKKAAVTLKAHKEKILAYFHDRLTNAIAEGINSMIQAAKRKARGFRTFEGFASMIFLIAGKLKLACGSPFPDCNFSRS